MKKPFLSLLIIFSPLIIFAQNAMLHISLSNSTSTGCTIWMPNVFSSVDPLKQGYFDIPLTAGKGAHEFKLTKPEFAYLMYSNSDTGNVKIIHYILYLSPGDNINFNADFKNEDNAIVVTGKGRNNNQPLIAALAGESTESLYGDTLPNRILAFANRHQAALKTALDKYIPLYKPSADFVKNEEINIQYDVAYQYYVFKGNNKFQIRQAYERNLAKWTAVQDSLFATVKLNNPEALSSINYVMLVNDFLLREKEALWDESFKNPQAFFKEWYNADKATGQKEFNADRQNLLQEKIINYYFTKQIAEYLYARLFDDALSQHNPENIVSIFDGFKLKYPGSKYIQWFGPAIDTIRVKETQPLTADIVLAENNGTSLNTFNDLLALTKGKTVLLDMWGTWCGPCRNEINENGPALRTYFKGKGLDFFYVANYDTKNEAAWKKLIAYFDMKGTHILASDSLSNSIMKTVKGTGFPTYVVIKKDGTWELSKAGYPMKRDILIKQLEEALKQ